MKFCPLKISGAYTIYMEPITDERGFFARAYCSQEQIDHGLTPYFVQANNSVSRQTGTLRGFHYQLGAHAEDKLIRCIAGSIIDVIIDLRQHSPTYLKHDFAFLNATRRDAVYIPRGCANAILTREPNTELFYLSSNYYTQSAERGIRWNDPAFAIDWPHEPKIVSEKDSTWPNFNKAYHLGEI